MMLNQIYIEGIKCTIKLISELGKLSQPSLARYNFLFPKSTLGGGGVDITLHLFIYIKR